MLCFYPFCSNFACLCFTFSIAPNRHLIVANEYSLSKCMNLYMRNKMTGLLLTVIQILGVIKYNHCSCLFKMLTHYLNLIVKSYSAISPGPSSRNIDGSCLPGRIAMLKIQQLQKLCLDLHLSPQPTPDKFHHPFFFLGFIFPELLFHP